MSGAKRSWILEKIWDKYLLPVPFTQGVVVYGEPIVVKGIEGRRARIQAAGTGGCTEPGNEKGR